jgi:CHAT domain-containing protein/Tfp pilus assembly protein PilF
MVVWVALFSPGFTDSSASTRSDTIHPDAEAIPASSQDPRLKEADQLENQARSFYSQGNPGAAVPLLRKALELREAVLPAGDIEIARTCNNLALILDEQGHYSDARPLYERTLQMLSADDPNRAVVLNNLAVVLGELAEYAAAKSLLDESLAMKEKARGPEHPDVATSLNNLAQLYVEQGEHAAARPLFERALRIREKAMPNHPLVAATLNSLALVAATEGEYTQARQLLTRALRIAEKTQGSTHPDVAIILNSMASLAGSTATARVLFEQALEIWQKSYGPEHPSVAAGLDNIAALFLRNGDYPAARLRFEKALRIREKAFGPEHPDFARSLNNLGTLLSSQGDYVEARAVVERAMKIFQQTLGSDHSEVASCLSNVALISQLSGNYPEAKSLYEKAVAIWERKLGPQRLQLSVGLSNLASLLQLNKELKQAQKLLERALAIQREIGGQNNPDVARSLNNLAHLHESQGDYMRARLLFKQALEVSESVFTADHPMTTLILDNAGLLDWLQKDSMQAWGKFIRAAKSVNNQTERVIPTLSFAEQRLFLRTQIPLQTSVLLSSAREGARLKEAYELLFRWKGLLIDNLRRQTNLTRLVQDEKHRLQAERLQTIRANLAGWYHKAGSVPREKWYEKNQTLTREKEALERELSNAGILGLVEDPLKEITIAKFRSTLARDEVFVDLYRYSFFESGKFVEDRFAAVLLSPDAGPILVDLGQARAVTSAIAQWRSDVIAQTDTSDASWRSLAALVWQPLVANLPPSAERVWVSADGELSRLPWQLLPSSHARTRRLLVAQTDSARELVNLRNRAGKSTKPSSLLLVGSIDFNSGSADQPAQEDFKPLEDTEFEISTLQSLGARQALAVALLTEDKANKPAVTRELSRASYAHLATHGFFYQSREANEEASVVQSRSPETQSPLIKSERNPLVESGLALAGANVRDPSSTEAVGLLTGEEIVGLDLSRCELITLSACNTGRGEEITGQGVMGLRAAIIGAGARTVVMSLWKVPSEATSKLMTIFYRNLWEKRLPKAQALLRAQEALRDDPSGKFKRPLFWAAWTLAGEGW